MPSHPESDRDNAELTITVQLQFSQAVSSFSLKRRERSSFSKSTSRRCQ
jgi:hypothetical protein